ncbi:cytochrome c biogenesis protein CcsA [Candidatus Oleimmundimicrobium sp.]|uniref:cytochrome c biogenesis protein CcsA n=1 Tax=Candidatus Oleimmundimicrobium sp. TaxID=3060597 RepID=UPI002716EB50|nr:cytochrome c biogenesis protein CcsA [Candidatus Oleimmundimicrobium sp.]MDO8885328.1 cytochrome c biogenesis protein CcsA [Candidatus Oleimmundimicrobium sp.]
MTLDKCIAHYILATLSQISLLIAGLGSGLYLILKKTSPDSTSKDFFLKKQYKLNLVCLIIGFLFFTTSFIIGLIQAKNLWGAYWSWDVKQIGSVILWFYYFVTLLTIGWLSFFEKKNTTSISSWLMISGIVIMSVNIFVLNIFSKLHHFL